MNPKFVALSRTTDFSMISLDLAHDAEALAVARLIADSTGRAVTVRATDGEIIEVVGPSPKN